MENPYAHNDDDGKDRDDGEDVYRSPGFYETDDEYDEEMYAERPCHWCGGDGWVECRDPIQCTYPHNEFGECQCASCGGSGLEKDMTIW